MSKKKCSLPLPAKLPRKRLSWKKTSCSFRVKPALRAQAVTAHPRKAGHAIPPALVEVRIPASSVRTAAAGAIAAIIAAAVPIVVAATAGVHVSNAAVPAVLVTTVATTATHRHAVRSSFPRC